jgi:hypothetical protein
MLGADLYNTVENNKQTDEDPEKVALDSPTTDSPKHPPGILKKPNENGEVDPKKQDKNTKEKKTGTYPVTLAVTILILWILLSSALFCLWEKEWGFTTSVYFFFVSISTVGLGGKSNKIKDHQIFSKKL